MKIQTSPPSVTSAAVAYDTEIQKAILFGGSNATWTNDAWVTNWSGETWEWDGNNWRKLTPINNPPGREKHVMTYDQSRGRIILFGGFADGSVLNDTWEWDGTNWHLMDPEHKPPARCCHAMAYDSSRKQVVLYGGWDSQKNTFFDDTWVWDGKDWSQIVSTGPAMSGHYLVDFPSRNEVISIQTANFGTWAWDGKQFTDLDIESPPSRTDVRAVYDSLNDRILLFGGIHDQTYLGDTWVFDGEKWSQMYLSTVPPLRFGQVMFYDTKRNSVMLFGGFQSIAPYYMNDTWELLLPSNLAASKIQATPSPSMP